VAIAFSDSFEMYHRLLRGHPMPRVLG